ERGFHVRMPRWSRHLHRPSPLRAHAQSPDTSQTEEVPTEEVPSDATNSRRRIFSWHRKEAPFPLRGKGERGSNILGGQIRKIRQDLFIRHTAGQIFKDIGHGDPCPSYNGLAVAYARVNHDTSQKSVHSHRPPRSSPFDRRLGVLSYKYIMQRTRVWPTADPRQLGQGFETPRGYQRTRTPLPVHNAGRCDASIEPTKATAPTPPLLGSKVYGGCDEPCGWSRQTAVRNWSNHWTNSTPAWPLTQEWAKARPQFPAPEDAARKHLL